MVTLYGPENLSMLRTASGSLGIGFQSQSHSPRTKKWTKHQYLELARPNENKEDALLSDQILTWLKILSLSDRISIVSHQAPLICTFLWQMFIKKLSEGELEYFFKINSFKNLDPDNLDHNFSTKKKSEESQTIGNHEFQIEKSFEQSIRLTDTEEYLDTLTLESDLCNDPGKLISHMKTISAGKAFSAPCHAVWDNVYKVFVFEYPAWFKPNSSLSLAAWACASIEKSIWMNYWELNNIDPRPVSQRSGLKNYKEKMPELNSYKQRENLSSYFSSLTQAEKQKIIGNLHEITQDYIEIRAHLRNYNTKFINFTSLPRFISTLYPLSRSLLPCYPNPVSCFYFYASKTKIKYYQSPKSAELILQQLNNSTDCKFIEFLLCSPLERSVTLLDIVVRKTLYRVINAYTEKNALELMLDESLKPKDNPDKNAKKKPKKNKNKKKKNKPKAIKTPTPEEKESIKSMIQDIIYNILDTNVSHKINTISDDKDILNKSSEFQEVQKKKHKKLQPQQKPKSVQKKNSKHWRKPIKPPLSDTKTVQKLPKEDLEGQELTSVPLKTPLECLHKEIIQFGESMTWKLEDKIHRINKILEKLNEIVLIAFEGASIELFGSYASGLAIEASDVDIVVSGIEITERVHLEDTCNYLADFIRDYPFISKIQAISTARIPVIKLEVNALTLVGTENLVMVDITFDDSCGNSFGSHLGLSTLYLTKELQRLYPSMQYLVLVLKQFLYDHNLNSSYKGGLSSYSLILWVAALLNSMPSVSENLGELLIEFLKYFGKEFDPSATGVNIMNGGSFFELDYKGYEAVVTIDPVNQLNNTRMSYQIHQVLNAFGKAYEKLTQMIQNKKKKKFLKNIFKNSLIL